MKTAAVWAVLFFVSGLVGCRPMRIGEPIAGDQIAITKAGSRVIVSNVSVEEKKLIVQSLDQLPIPVQRSIRAVQANCADTGYYEPAHFHPDTDTICLEWLGDYEIICEYLWHEAGHAQTFAAGRMFEMEWNEVAGRVYGVRAPPKNTFFPYDGILDSYGATNWLEDVACWMEEIYFYLNGWRSRLNGVDNSNPKYKEKLALLLTHGFITKANYEKIAPLLRK